MTTTITKTIGIAAGRDCASVLAFFNLIPANLVAVDQQWIGEFYNDGELVTTADAVLTSRVTDPTRNIILRPATGQGFASNATAATNALTYDATKGVALKFNNYGGINLKLTADYTEVRGLQIQINDASPPSNVYLEGNYCKAIANIVQSQANAPLSLSGNFTEAHENLIIASGSGAAGLTFGYGGNCLATYNTIYAAASSSNNAISVNANGQVFPVCKNNAIFGFTTPILNGDPSSSNNGTDAPNCTGTANLLGLLFTENFVSITDLHVKSTSVLIGASTAIAGQTIDILSRPRANPSTIGCFSYNTPTTDTTPPTMTGTITVSAISSTGFTVSYPAATDNVAVTGYEISIDAGVTYSNVGNVLTVIKSGLTANTVYSVKVRAYDAANNKAVPLAASVTTSAPPATTTTAGKITTPAMSNNTGTLLAGTSGWRALVHDTASGNLIAAVNTLTASATGTLTITNPALVAGTTYRVIVVSPTGDEGMGKMAAA